MTLTLIEDCITKYLNLKLPINNLPWLTEKSVSLQRKYFKFIHFVLKQNESKIQYDLLGNYKAPFANTLIFYIIKYVIPILDLDI